MKHLKMLGLAAVAATALMAFVGAGTASATTLEVGGVAQNKSVSLVASLATGTSAILKDNLNIQVDTCTESTVEGKTEETETTKFTGTKVGGAISKLTFGNCTDTTTVIKPG